MNSIEEILTELYAIDSSFKRHEGDLRLLIRRLRLAKPDFSIDDAFVRRLRSDILYSGKPKPAGFLIRSYFLQTTKNLFRSSAFGMAVALLLLVPLTYTAKLYQQSQQPTAYQVDHASVSLSNQQEISYKPKNAFGLVALTSINASTTQTQSLFSTITLATSSLTAIQATTTVSNNGTTSPAYLFIGSPSVLGKSTANVLEIDTSSSTRSQLLTNIQNLGFQLSDITSIANANNNVGTIEIQESKPFGYVVSIDLNKMAVSISKNQSVWPDETNFPILTDTNATDTINTAITFLREHNINTASYGEPNIISENSASSTATILLPLIIHQKNVYNPDGSPYGMVISVDQKLGKVTKIKGILLQKFTASPYPVITNFQDILNFLNATTSASTTLNVASSTPLTIATMTLPQLETPSSGLIHYLVNNNEFFVPGLIFPVMSSTTIITVPILENYSN